MQILRPWCLLWAAMLLADPAHAADMTREQAVKALEQPQASVRLAAVQRLAEIGRMADADRLVGRLGDADPQVRESASDAMWRIWSRSGDPAIDKLFARGVQQMQGSDYDDALTTFNEIVARKPEFAEGWNKRATVHYLAGDFRKSLADCAEVIKRNPSHFGALSGYGQVYFQLEEYDQAIRWWKRALEVNPNMTGVEINIKGTEELLKKRRGRAI